MRQKQDFVSPEPRAREDAGESAGRSAADRRQRVEQHAGADEVAAVDGIGQTSTRQSGQREDAREPGALQQADLDLAKTEILRIGPMTRLMMRRSV